MSPIRTHRRGAGALTVFLLYAAVLRPAAADEVRLANGDRLTGTAVRLAGGELVFTTGYAGEVTIDWSQVVALTTDQPVRLVLEDDTRLQGAVSPPPDRPDGSGAPGEMTTEPRAALAAVGLDAPVVVPLATIREINPKLQPAIKLSGSLSAGLLASRGNTETDTTYLEGEFIARGGKNRYTVGASFKEAKDGGSKTASRTYGYARYDRFFGERWYFNSNASLTEDEFQDLDLRTIVGLATGFQVLDSERAQLAVELGASHVDENFIAAPDDRFVAGRWSLEFAYNFAGDRVELFHRHEGLVGLEDTADLLLHAQTGARFSLVGKLVATTQLNLDYTKSPSPGRQTTDRTYLATVGFEW